MIKSVTFTNYLGDSVKIELTEAEPDHGFVLIGMDGLGPAKADINTTTLATNDGDVYNSARLEKRNILVSLVFTPTNTIEDTRQRTYKYFPNKKYLTIHIETDNRILETTGYVESNEPDIFSDREGCEISIICPDPLFYSAGEDGMQATVFSGIEPGFEFAFSNESLELPLIEFGTINLETEKTIYYEGDAEIGVRITIHALGSASQITIYNTGTREIMHIDTDKLEQLTGSGITAGDDIIISTVRNQKYVRLLREGIYVNILNCVDKHSDWFQLAKGDNIFAYTAESGSENLQFRIDNRISYTGV